jgi:hypothetical protein
MGKRMYRSTLIDLCTSWRWVFSFNLRPLYPWGKSSRYPLDRRLGGPQNRCGRRWRQNIYSSINVCSHMYVCLCICMYGVNRPVILKYIWWQMPQVYSFWYVLNECWDSSVSIAIRVRVGRPRNRGLIRCKGKSSRTHTATYTRGTGAVSLERKAHYAYLSRVEVNSTRAIPQVSNTFWWLATYLIKHWDDFPFEVLTAVTVKCHGFVL